jgi:chromosome partitioning protein
MEQTKDFDAVKKTITVSLASIKGGVGKTHIVILLARFLAARGIKVLLIDSDLNNSLTFNLLDKDLFEKAKRLNFFAALSDEGNDLRDYAVKTKIQGIDLIASSAHLSDLRGVNEKRLKRMIKTLDGHYDICLIDCHPTYDNIVLNALHASDYVITPVLKDSFSYNAAVFFSEVLPRDVEDLPNWYVLLNGYDNKYAESKFGVYRDFVRVYREKGLPLTPKETWFPWTYLMRHLIDGNKRLSWKPNLSGTVYHKELYNAVYELGECFFESLEKPEAF